MTRPSVPWAAALSTAIVVLGVMLRAGQQIQVQGTFQGGVVSGFGAIDGPSRDGVLQSLKTGTSRISGRVLGVNGVPLRQAAVRIMAQQAVASRSTVTDQDGRYEFHELPAGRYTVSVSKAGFVNLIYGQSKPEDPPKSVVVADGQAADGINIVVPRGGVIAGRVVDEFGEPVTDAQVMTLQRRYAQGQMRFVNSGRTAITNDIGEFRLYGLMPGKYYVSASARSASGGPPGTSEVRTGYAPTYYPATATAADAQPVTVGLGETIGGIDIGLSSARLATISGSAIDSKGGMVRRGAVNVTTRDGVFSPGLPGTSIQDDGTFMLAGVPPGEYVLRAGSVQPNLALATAQGDRRAELERAVQPEMLTAIVTVNGSDISGVLLVPQRRITVGGRFTFDPAAGASLRSSMMSIAITAFGIDALGTIGPTQTLPVREDFTFEMTSPATEVMIRPTVRHPDWVVKAVRVSGTDVTDTGLDLRNAGNVFDVEVELTNHPPELAGVVSDSRGQPIANATIVIFPEDRRRWLFDTRLMPIVRADLQGRYRVRTLPPGRYLAAAMEFMQPMSTQDPDFLEALRPRATAVSLADQEGKTLNFTVSGPR